MRQLLYAKYNSLRKPEFQVATFIISENGDKKVTKRVQNQGAKTHFDNIKKNYDVINDIYNRISPVSFSEENDSLVFPFVNGESILSDINFETVNDSNFGQLVQQLSEKMELILDIKDEYKTKFSITEEFKSVFGDIKPVEGTDAFCISNLDCIFDNFVITQDSIVSIDYEWMLDFPVPADYLKYRMLVYLFNENAAYLSKLKDIEEFLECFGFSTEDIKVYSDMEDSFQQYVHGENRKYIYLNRYQKKAQRFEELYEDYKYKTKVLVERESHVSNLEDKISTLDNELEKREEHIENLQEIITRHRKDIEEQNQHVRNMESIIETQKEEVEKIRTELNETTINLVDEIKKRDDLIRDRDEQIMSRDEQINLLNARVNKLYRCIKNPLYGIYAGTKSVPGKVKRRVEYNRIEKENKERERQEQELLELQKQEEERVKNRLKELHDETEGNYEKWINKVEQDYDYDKIFKYNPLISILVPVYNVEDRHLIPCIESVKNQIYKNWELILVDDCSTYENVKKTLKKQSRFSKRIKVYLRKENGGISKCTNSALKKAKGEFVSFLDCDDLLRPNALYEVVKALNANPKLDFIYSDEDKVDDDGTNRHAPFFKPDWSPDTMMSYMYTCHFSTFRTSIAKKIGGLKTKYDGCQDYDFVLRFTEKTDNIYHIDKVLYHWRERKESTSINPEAKEYVKEAAKNCKNDAIKRRGQSADIEWIPEVYQYRVNYKPVDDPLVSVIIPSKDNPNILKQCLESFTTITSYKHYEFIVVDNGSNEQNKSEYEKLTTKYNCKYLYEKKDFNFSHMCNSGAKVSNGRLLLFLNDDIEIIQPDWLEKMVGHAQLKHVGAVGAKLLYPNTTLIQHAGVINIESGPVHEFAKMDDQVNYYFNRNRLDFDTIAVTAACLLIDRDKYNKINGFDEELAVAYNDIDFCFKLVEAGYYNVIRNDVILYHHESLSRGDDTLSKEKFTRLMMEQRKLYTKHKQFHGKDPFYNSNLSQVDCDFKYNYEMLNEYKVSELHKEVKGNDNPNIKGGIDVKIVDWCVYIEGWIFETQSDQNIWVYPEIILKGKKSYIISTAKVHRKDVAKTFFDETNIEYCGFKCRVNRDFIDEDQYSIYLKYNDDIYDTGVELIR